MSKRGGGGFGLVMLVVVMAVVLLLVARAWRETAPTAIEVTQPTSFVERHDHGQPEAVRALGDMPRLNDVRQRTGEHAEELEEALAATE